MGRKKPEERSKAEGSSLPNPTSTNSTTPGPEHLRARTQDAHRREPYEAGGCQCAQCPLEPSQGRREAGSKGPRRAQSLWEEGSMDPGLASHGRVWWPQDTLLISEIGLPRFPFWTVIFQDMMTDEEKM